MLAQIEPLEKIEDLKKGILVPEPDFELWLQRYDWTWHQLARGEYPAPFYDIESFQLACICADPLLWCQAFLREPEDPDHAKPYGFWDYQIESLRYMGNKVHYDAAEVGKTREIVALNLYDAFNNPNGSGLVGAPQQTHLDEIIEAMADQLFSYNPLLGKSVIRHKKSPHHALYFTNKFKIDFRPAGHDGEAYRGVHAKTFVRIDEAAKKKNKKQWSEMWRAVKPGCRVGVYSVPDGDRSCEFYRLGQRAKGKGEEGNLESFGDVSTHIKSLEFKLYHWPKTLMPYPYWSGERRKFYIEQYGGEDSAEYRHNVLGEDGDPEHSVFPWHHFGKCIREIPEYRCLKVLVDSSHGEVSVTGYKCEYVAGDSGPVPRVVDLIDEYYDKASFFDGEFGELIRSFFVKVPGLKRGGADFGYSGDPTEIIVKVIIGKTERVIARLYMKHVTYDEQCEAIDAIDDVYGPDINWGTDFGNAGSAVTHFLQGSDQYSHKDYESRLMGFQFESTSENISEEGIPVLDAKTGKPAKITLKELATDLLVKKVQRQEVEYPPDPDYAFAYPNHTVRAGSRHRIFKKDDDHLIDADRVCMLALVLADSVEDIFA